MHFSHWMSYYQKGRAFPLVGVTVRHLHLTVADAVIMITEESHYFSGGSMSNKYLDDESIDLVVTSPPYDNLRKYNGLGGWME